MATPETSREEMEERIDVLANIDHEGREKIDFCPGGNNHDRHADNLSRLHGVWFKGAFYWHGQVQRTEDL